MQPALRVSTGPWGPTRIDEGAIDARADQPLDWRYKAAPSEVLTLRELRHAHAKTDDGSA
jgi:hypothetical protein